MFGASCLAALCQNHATDVTAFVTNGSGSSHVILAFEVFAVVAGLGGTTLFPVLMGETYAYQFELLNSGVGRRLSRMIILIDLDCLHLRSSCVLLRVPKGAHDMTAITTRRHRRWPRDTRKAGRYVYVSAVVLLLCLVLVPLYFLLINTLSLSGSGQRRIQRAFFPELRFGQPDVFLQISRGSLTGSARTRCYVAALTMIMSIAIGAPAGYALSRFEFRGKEAVQASHGAADPGVPAAAPGVAARGHVHPGRGSTTPCSAWRWCTPRLAMPFAVLITFSLFIGHSAMSSRRLPGHSGCTRDHGIHEGGLAAGPARDRGLRGVRLRDSWNEVFAACGADHREPDAHRVPSAEPRATRRFT